MGGDNLRVTMSKTALLCATALLFTYLGCSQNVRQQKTTHHSKVATRCSANRPLEIPKISELSIDGDLCDWVEQGYQFPLIANSVGHSPPQSSLSASFRIGWNSSGLLIGGTIQDQSIVVSKDPANSSSAIGHKCRAQCPVGHTNLCSGSRRQRIRDTLRIRMVSPG